MNDLDAVTWAPLCIGLTAFGLFASWRVWRRRGLAAGMRGAAWSLLPLAAYLTGVVTLFWKIGTAVTRWVSGFVFSPLVWAGVAVTGLSAALFVASAVLRRRHPASGAGTPAAADAAPTRPELAPAGTGRKASGKNSGRKGTAGGDEFADVEEILRRRGIT